MISKAIVAMCFALSGLVLSDIGVTKTEGFPLHVTAVATQETGAPALEFEVTNIGTQVVTIYVSSLPWEYRYAVLILAVPEGKDALPGSYPVIDAFPSEPIKLQPGITMKGRVALSDHVLGVMKEFAHGPLLVFWYYAPLGTKGAHLGEYGGWVVFRGDSTRSSITHE
jgi:hypothetical protein